MRHSWHSHNALVNGIFVVYERSHQWDELPDWCGQNSLFFCKWISCNVSNSGKNDLSPTTSCMQGTDEMINVILLALGNSLCMWSINCIIMKFVAFHVCYVHHEAGKFKLKLYRPIPEGYQKFLSLTLPQLERLGTYVEITSYVVIVYMMHKYRYCFVYFKKVVKFIKIPLDSHSGFRHKSE